MKTLAEKIALLAEEIDGFGFSPAATALNLEIPNIELRYKLKPQRLTTNKDLEDIANCQVAVSQVVLDNRLSPKSLEDGDGFYSPVPDMIDDRGTHFQLSDGSWVICSLGLPGGAWVA